MNKKIKSIKTFVLALALGTAILFPVSLNAQGDIGNGAFGGSSGDIPLGNQSFGSDGGYDGIGNQWFGTDAGYGGLGNQSFGFDDGYGSMGNESFGSFIDEILGIQIFGDMTGGGALGNQGFGGIYDENGNLGNQSFGEGAPLGNGLIIMLIAGAGYAFYKKQRTYNKQKNLEK